MPAAPLQQRFSYGDTVNEDVLRGLGAISGRLLDLGSGVGAWAPRLRDAGARELVALDASPAAIEVARTRYDKAVCAGIEDCSLDDLGGEPFDVVVAADVLEHLVDPWMALRLLRRWTRPGGTLAVSVPNMRFYRLVGNLALRGEFEYEAFGVRDWTHLRWFTRNSLGRMLRAAGWAPRTWVGTATPKGRLLARLSDQVANDLLRQQLVVVATAVEPGSDRPAVPGVRDA